MNSYASVIASMVEVVRMHAIENNSARLHILHNHAVACLSIILQLCSTSKKV